MQDYGRAVVVGDSKTFGKGTVQQMIELSRAVPFLANGTDAGAVKLTIQKFYRVAGGSTQLRGVESDITLPSVFDQPELSEESLKDPLPYDTFSAVDFDKWDKPLHLDELRRRAQARIPQNPEFAYVLEDLERIRKRTAENRVSLNEQVRQAELEEDKARKESRDLERQERAKEKDPKVYRLTLDNVSKKELVQVKFVEPKTPKEGAASSPDDEDAPTSDAVSEPQKDKDGKLVFKSAPIRYDPVKQETLNLLGTSWTSQNWTFPPRQKRSSTRSSGSLDLGAFHGKSMSGSRLPDGAPRRTQVGSPLPRRDAPPAAHGNAMGFEVNCPFRSIRFGGSPPRFRRNAGRLAQAVSFAEHPENRQKCCKPALEHCTIENRYSHASIDW
jgi:hypothetical protein